MKFFIAVKPVGSGFAKTLQKALKDATDDHPLRTTPDRLNLIKRRRDARRWLTKAFHVTPRTLNKIEQFRAFTAAGVSCPKFTLTAAGINDLGCSTVFARTLVNSTGGKGIVEIQVDRTGATQYPRAPLYTEYIPKKAEYRVHVFNGEVIDVQQKKKKREFNVDNRDTRVRNLHNGYVYTRDGIQPPAGMGQLAVNAVNAVGYNYGAVDIIYNEKRNQCYVLEVNSRPGLMGTTLEKYTNALINTYQLKRK